MSAEQHLICPGRQEAFGVRQQGLAFEQVKLVIGSLAVHGRIEWVAEVADQWTISITATD